MKNIENILVKETDTIECAVRAIQEGHEGIALVVDNNKKLLATITDGDIRRAILNKIEIGSPISRLLLSRGENHPCPIVASIDTSNDELLKMMEKDLIRQIPLLNKNESVVDIALLNDLLEEERTLPLTAIIMAGGRGERLMPLTKNMPKPMLEIDQTPLLHRIVEQLKNNGISNIFMATNYRAEIIKDYFKDGSNHGVKIGYIDEQEPLGTAGALGLFSSEENRPILVINGDILTQLNFHLMYDFHNNHNSDLTMGVRIYETEIPYGVIETDDIRVKSLKEKPVHASIVNAGIYILNYDMLQFVPKNKFFNMTDLIEVLLKEGKTVISFPIQEYWLDIGHPADYTRAKTDVKNGSF